MMRAFRIDAHNRTINEFEYEFGKLHEVFTNGLCIAYKFPTGDVLYVDDEGMMHKVTAAFRVMGHGPYIAPFIGDAVLTGPDHMIFKGNKHVGGIDDADDYEETTLPPVMGIRELSKMIEWVTVDEALNWYRMHANEPASTITTSHGTEVLSTYGDFLRAMEGKDETI